ncbi:MAG: 4Fe-4S binding protein [Lachnospiraceae bacterium]|nr:4Fe-4S binding protein [Lachnospiraceae bacterium]
MSTNPTVIDQSRCLHCGRCAELCPEQAIEKRG